MKPETITKLFNKAELRSSSAFIPLKGGLNRVPSRYKKNMALLLAVGIFFGAQSVPAASSLANAQEPEIDHRNIWDKVVDFDADEIHVSGLLFAKSLDILGGIEEDYSPRQVQLGLGYWANDESIFGSQMHFQTTVFYSHVPGETYQNPVYPDIPSRNITHGDDYELGLYGMFRWYCSLSENLHPFAGLGLGVVYLSRDLAIEGLGSSTNFYIPADLIGLAFGKQNEGPRFETSVRYSHTSNAKLDSPDHGMNTLGVLLSVTYPF